MTCELRLAERDARLADASLEEVPDQNWVALSQASLSPIAAGRLVVHGSHDRARFGCGGWRWRSRPARRSAAGTTPPPRCAWRRSTRLARQPAVACGACSTWAAAAACSPSPRRAWRRRRASSPPTTIPSPWRSPGRTRGSTAWAAACGCSTATGLSHPALRRARPFDLVLANILPGPLIALAPALRRAIRRGGVAVLSGLLDHQAREVAAAYRACGFHLLRALAARRVDGAHGRETLIGCGSPSLNSCHRVPAGGQCHG